jgi:uncharacterized protein
LAWAIAVLATGYLFVVCGLYVSQRFLLYPADRSVPGASAAGVAEMRSIRLRTSDGLDLLAWYRRAAEGKLSIVYLHGNGGHIGYRGERVRAYLDAGFGVLLVEYRGYGGNPGSPSERGLYEDARAAIAFVAADGVPASRTVLYGESLGSTIAVAMAAEASASGRSIAALILEAPLSSVIDVAAHHYPWVPVRWLMKDRFEAIALIAGISAPLLIVHGEGDAVVPIRFARALFASAQQPKDAVWIPQAGHENLPAHGLRQIVFDFLARRVRDRDT